ncbi:MAG: Crp/Fnr family transcriptional regulator [Prevotella sp.]|nr:Crp/Fnr family transcriptional regulator [Prevotella sp.]
MDIDLKLYDHLLRFQLFQGLSRSELLQMAGNTKFGFLKEPSGCVLLRDGDTCQGLYFLVSGSLAVSTRSADGGYRLEEQLSAPWLLQPEALFGAHPRYSGTWRTATPCHFITLSKDEVLRLLDDFLIIRLNLLNLFSTQAQRRGQQQWQSTPKPLRNRFQRFLLHRCVYPAGPKELHILMTRLADELCSSRLDTSHMLNALQTDGLVQLHRGRISIPSLEKLLQG